MADQEAGAQEFPKMLYQGGEARDEAQRPVHHSQTRLVADAEEEKAARAEGFLPAGGDPVEAEVADDETSSDSETEATFNGADPAAFDHDGDGQPGGAPRGGNRKKSA